jgi:hypothetical protein
MGTLRNIYPPSLLQLSFGAAASGALLAVMKSAFLPVKGMESEAAVCQIVREGRTRSADI